MYISACMFMRVCMYPSVILHAEWCVVAWRGVVCCDVAWHGMVGCGMARHAVAWRGVDP